MANPPEVDLLGRTIDKVAREHNVEPSDVMAVTLGVAVKTASDLGLAQYDFQQLAASAWTAYGQMLGQEPDRVDAGSQEDPFKPVTQEGTSAERARDAAVEAVLERERATQAGFRAKRASHHISVLLASVMQPAIAGGVPETRAKEIYEEVMGAIAELSEEGFETLRDDLLLRWAQPLLGSEATSQI